MADTYIVVRVLDGDINRYVRVKTVNGEYPPGITGFFDPIRGEAAVAPSYFLGWLPGRYTLWQTIKHLITERRWVRSWPATYVRTRGIQVICTRCSTLVTTAVSHVVGDQEAKRHNERHPDHTRRDVLLVAQEIDDDNIVSELGMTVGELRHSVGL